MDLLTKDQLIEVLESPFKEHYVYRLWTPKHEVFFIGKGSKLTALSHEKEIFKRSYRVHTNWKKLNRIASIIASGNEILYDIESWHDTPQTANRQKECLIIMGEQDNPRILCNSDGNRWRGKPSKVLIDIRSQRGLETYYYKG